MRTPQAARRKDRLLRANMEEALGSLRAEGAAPEVAMATEPVAAESAAPSLVDRYFTRWYKAGKWGIMSVSPGPYWPDAIGTTVTRQKPRALSPALQPHDLRNLTILCLFVYCFFFKTGGNGYLQRLKSPQSAFWGWRALREFLGGLLAGRWFKVRRPGRQGRDGSLLECPRALQIL